MSFAQVVDAMNNYDLILFANECERTYKLADLNIASSKKVAIIIGSEGGFSDKEIGALVSAGAKSITLGKRILRAETASIALTAVVMSNIGEWEYE